MVSITKAMRNFLFSRSNEGQELENEFLDVEENLEVGSEDVITTKEQLKNLLHSSKFQMAVVILVVVDTLIVITELLLDLEMAGTESRVPEVLHSISITLLCIFVIELCLKMYTYGVHFFKMKGEVFDGVVVVTALALDVASVHSSDAFAGSGLIIVLRLWRIVRVQNSIVLSARLSGERRLQAEVRARKSVEAELERLMEINGNLRRHCRVLSDLLEQNGVKPPVDSSITETEDVR